MVFWGLSPLHPVLSPPLLLIEMRRRTKRRASTDDGERQSLLGWISVLLSHLVGVKVHAGLHLLGGRVLGAVWKHTTSTVAAFFFPASLGVPSRKWQLLVEPTSS